MISKKKKWNYQMGSCCSQVGILSLKTRTSTKPFWTVRTKLSAKYEPCNSYEDTLAKSIVSFSLWMLYDIGMAIVLSLLRKLIIPNLYSRLRFAVGRQIVQVSRQLCSSTANHNWSKQRRFWLWQQIRRAPHCRFHQVVWPIRWQ